MNKKLVSLHFQLQKGERFLEDLREKNEQRVLNVLHGIRLHLSYDGFIDIDEFLQQVRSRDIVVYQCIRKNLKNMLNHKTWELNKAMYREVAGGSVIIGRERNVI